MQVPLLHWTVAARVLRFDFIVVALGAALGPILAYSLAPRFGVAVVYMLGAGALALMAIFHAFGYAARGSQRV